MSSSGDCLFDRLTYLLPRNRKKTTHQQKVPAHWKLATFGWTLFTLTVGKDCIGWLGARKDAARTKSREFKAYPFFDNLREYDCFFQAWAAWSSQPYFSFGSWNVPLHRDMCWPSVCLYRSAGMKHRTCSRTVRAPRHWTAKESVPSCPCSRKEYSLERFQKSCPRQVPQHLSDRSLAASRRKSWECLTPFSLSKREPFWRLARHQVLLQRCRRWLKATMNIREM